MKKINDVEVKGKAVAIRIDVNLPVKDGKIELNKRIKEHAKTINELSEKGARLIILGHQGKKGKEDFVSMDKHAELLEKISGKKIKFIDIIDFEKIREEIRGLKEGEILLLENIRFLEEETERPFNAKFIERLSTVCEYFVLDALSVAHREHASVVGLTKHLKSFMGSVLEREVKALERLKGAEKVTFIVGGAKVKDSIKIMKYWLELGKVERVLTAGALAILFLKAKSGTNVGKENEEYLEKVEGNEYLEEVKKILEKYSEKIEVPEDFVLDVQEKAEEFEIKEGKIPHGAIKDIGPKTIQKYEKIIENSKMIVLNGPMGVYEQEEFETGTKKILYSIANSKGFSLIGGGHTISAIQKFGIREDNFGYVSLSGKAFLQYLSGRSLPGLVALMG